MNNAIKEKSKDALTIDNLEKELGQKFAYPASSKSFLIGSRPDIKAPYRLIEQTPTKTSDGSFLDNPPIPVYDTSGPYSDPEVFIHLGRGLPT